jgi:hypothetical protein
MIVSHYLVSIKSAKQQKQIKQRAPMRARARLPRPNADMMTGLLTINDSHVLTVKPNAAHADANHAQK